MLSRKSKRKLLLVAGLVMLMGLLAGCGVDVNGTKETSDLINGNFWEKNVVYYFAVTLDTFAGWFGNSYGLAVLMLTIIVRTAILPLTLKQYRSSKAMQAIQPKMQEIQKKYKDNPEKLQMEMMKLYQANGVNPLAGCLPMFVQMPVFIALYNAIYWNQDLRLHEFLGLQLGEPSPWYFLPLLAAATSFIQTKMMQKSQPQQQQMAAMSMIMNIFPIMIFVMSLSFPAALPLYWVYSNLYTIVQNYFMYYRPASRKGKEVAAK
ncbi:YidC/Oxa1 family membrane protein insertase [Paenibacillus yanchengensis]|uniref:YidC/Oxa1 family membrane protein insertase n=1 Tax=Paenibacillus yanchengensis TaxID=2035833 RepID=A0ABW4YNW4_9BACL